MVGLFSVFTSAATPVKDRQIDKWLIVPLLRDRDWRKRRVPEIKDTLRELALDTLSGFVSVLLTS